MPLSIPAVQSALREEGLDGWLLYDFHGSNPIAVNLAGLAGKHTTRRWYYFIPAKGTPRKLVHAIEPFMLDALPGDKQSYAGRLQLEEGVSGSASPDDLDSMLQLVYLRFTAPLADMETFLVDYQARNLRIKIRKGRQFNFTDPDDNADRLFVFHRDVERARQRLAQ